MRRAEYSEGSGLLATGGDWLFFVSAVDHPAASSLREAAQSDRPLRALAAVVTGAEFNVPPFIFIQAAEGLQSIVCGAIQLEVDDTEMSLVDGASADPWAHLRISETATVSSGGRVAGDLWVESGVVRADTFRWSPRTAASAPPVPSRAADSARRAVGTSTPAPEAATVAEPEAAASETYVEPATAVADGPGQAAAAIVGGPAPAAVPAVGAARRLGSPTPSESHEPLVAPGAPSADADVTVEAVLLAKSLNERHGELASAVSSPTSPRRQTSVDATVDLAPGEVLLDESPAPLRTVDALICLECHGPNPPMTARCRSCSVLLSEANSGVRTVPQPCLGRIHLSGGREEPLDADLLIGRNPARDALGPHQRAVVHGTGDRSISRRHIELKLEGWQVTALNLKKGAGTTVESRLGGCTKLLPGVPHQLAEGDTVQFGGTWLRYEGI